MNQRFDLLVIGGGLAGMSTAILAAIDGFKVAVVEKESYPRHKVCGEFISNESRPFLHKLGVDLNWGEIPEIEHFKFFSDAGYQARIRLSPGGFGVSRYALDEWMHQRAIGLGVTVLENERVLRVEEDLEGHRVHTHKGQSLIAKLAIGSWGRSGGVLSEKPRSAEAWIGVKYHLASGPPKDEIEIHAFDGGYAGVSAIEGERYCLAYLCKTSKLKEHGSIERLEEQVLKAQPALANRLGSEKLVGPVTTSQFYFGVHPQPSGSTIPLLGDAAAFIPPLTGNGMSLAFRSANELYPHLKSYLSGTATRDEVLKKHGTYVKGYLRHRVRRGIWLQNLLFLRPLWIHRLTMRLLCANPILLKWLNALAVGKTIR